MKHIKVADDVHKRLMDDRNSVQVSASDVIRALYINLGVYINAYKHKRTVGWDTQLETGVCTQEEYNQAIKCIDEWLDQPNSPENKEM